MGNTEKLQETQTALKVAHEALHWLGRVRAYLDGPGHPRTATELVKGFYLFAVAECCAELHAQGTMVAITLDDVIELAGWDADNARAVADEAWQALLSKGFVVDKPARLVL